MTEQTPRDIIARRISLNVATISNDCCGDQITTDDIFRDLAEAGFALVPVKPTENMIEELARIGDGPLISGEECWGYMLAAATAAMHGDGELENPEKP